MNRRGVGELKRESEQRGGKGEKGRVKKEEQRLKRKGMWRGKSTQDCRKVSRDY